MGADVTLSAEVLLFDMDGTLVDSTKSAEDAWVRFAARHGIDAEKIVAVSHGRPTIEVVAQFAPPGLDIQAETDRIESEEIDRTEGITEIPGAAALLASLDPERWAVVTSASRPLTVKRLPAAGLPLPKVLITADDIVRGKPDPQGYRMAAEALGFDAANAVVFEDAEAGLLAGRAAKAATVVVGDYNGLAAEGLPRIADMRSVRVTPNGTGLGVSLG
ncbi:HAD-IA family hydrolase [Glycomyces buryatensis]|uniref:HAD family hydrolase n=1 Tax=Glycomyces buryatensis TaxID=2570927 RepID=A0A4S8PUW6_9ACTN|nr:HAD-IA family hydrolase [Glycomyces buryatensis]THV33532.1 HAD family hydrolase [Glycomyces buryatensis]